MTIEIGACDVLMMLLGVGVEDGGSVDGFWESVDDVSEVDEEMVELMSVVGSLLVVSVGVESGVEDLGGSEVGVGVGEGVDCGVFVVMMVFTMVGAGTVDIIGTGVFVG